MVKPTMLQSLFNKPSQIYSASSTPAASLEHLDVQPLPPLTRRSSIRSRSSTEDGHPGSSAVSFHSNTSTPSQPAESSKHAGGGGLARRPSEYHSMKAHMMRVAIEDQTGHHGAGTLFRSHTISGARSQSFSSLAALVAKSSSRPKQSSPYPVLSRRDIMKANGDIPPSPTDSDNEVFYTPLSTPIEAPAATPDSTTSLASESATDYSWPLQSDLTRGTSPEPHEPSSSKRHSVPRSLPSSSLSGDWAKDVRWLGGAPSSIASGSSRSSRRSRSVRTRSDARRLQTRMSAVPEENSDNDDAVTISVVDSSPRARVHSSPHLPRRTSRGTRSVHSVRSSGSTSSTFTSRTVDVPPPMPISSAPTGYTSLVLPRASYNPSKNAGKHSSTVDLTLSGLAQTTISTISITRKFAKLDVTTPAHLRKDQSSSLSFTSHVPPPTKVGKSQVLVHVWAVAVDDTDRALARGKDSPEGHGFVPGRSFVGKVVECGFTVDTLNKSDWVFGLLDIRKSGALAEFIVVDKRRLDVAPRFTQSLNFVQTALLPLAGVPAHRAVRTIHSVRPGSRALVLGAHEYAGAFAVQELASLGIHVVAQVPAEGIIVRSAAEVAVGAALIVVASRKSEEFDYVVDTTGGRPLWDACRLVLRPHGQFTTLVGDENVQKGNDEVGAQTVLPSPKSNFKSGLRALRRAFSQKIVYEVVSPAAEVDTNGDDVRDSLRAVAQLAEQGILRPTLPDKRHVFTFEKAPNAFAMSSSGRTAVIRLKD